MVDFAIILAQIWDSIIILLKSPFIKPEIWWYLFPIIALWFTLTIYFGHYKSEKIGWNTALSNGFSLCWVSIESMRVLFEHSYDPFILRFTLTSLALLYGIFTIYVAFTHKFKEKISFIISSTTLTYFLSGTLVLWAHNTFELNLWTFISLIIIFLTLVSFVTLLKKFLPNKSTDDSHQYEKMGFDENSNSSNSPSDFSSPSSNNLENNSNTNNDSSAGDSVFGNMFS